jgi:CubicO group peptidase (beta-lactamase class C family)
LILAASLSACDQSTQRSTTQSAAQSSEQSLDPAEVEKWADDFFNGMLDEHRISAGAIGVTQGDRVLLTKGYGYSDAAEKIPVDAETSQFRIGSLTKTFLATAIAQLLENGDIESLNDNVNKYLTRVQAPTFAGQEITIWDMLTHQGGLGRAPVFVPDTGERRAIAPYSSEYIEKNMPVAVREPGTISIYCNPCSATLGFMVEDITGQTLGDYLRENVFSPLGMSHTTLTNAPEPDPNVVTQYAYLPGLPPVELPYPVITPYISYAGDINSTASDMANWLIANIQQGRGPGPKLLSPGTYELMHSRKRGNHPATSGFGMKFFVYDYNGEPMLEHYGSIRYRSLELIMLNRKIGIFVTVAGGGRPNSEIDLPQGDTSAPVAADSVEEAASHSGMRAAVLEHFLGPLPIPAEQEQSIDLSMFTGRYFRIPADQTAEPTGTGVLVEATDDGGLVIGGLGVYRPSGSDTFTLDGRLPLEAGFRESNRYTFVAGSDGSMRMFPHINAGGLVRGPK